MSNKLYFGDNLPILKTFGDETVDMVFLDPHSTIAKMYWSEETNEVYEELVKIGGKVSLKMKRLYEDVRTEIGCRKKKKSEKIGKLDFLVNLTARLIESKRVLKSTGVICYHGGVPAVTHVVESLLNAVVGEENFITELMWVYKSGGAGGKYMARKHDPLFLYAKDLERFVYHPQYEPMSNYDKVLKTKKILVDEKSDRPDKRYYEGSQGQKHWLMINMRDVIYLNHLNQGDFERAGFKDLDVHQKPEKLYEPVVKAFSNPGSIILAPYCGSGTVLRVAQKLDRLWIGIDHNYPAFAATDRKLLEVFGGNVEYEVIIDPQNSQEAKDLADNDPHRFKEWALSQLSLS